MADVNNERNIQEADKKRQQGLRQNAGPVQTAEPPPQAAQASVNPAAAEAVKNPTLRNFGAAKDEARAARLAAEPPKTFMGIRFDSSLPGADTRQASKNIQAAKPPTAVEPTKGLRSDPVPSTAVEPAEGPSSQSATGAEDLIGMGGVNPNTTAQGVSSPTGRGGPTQGIGAKSPEGSLDHLVNPDQIRFINNDAILASADQKTGKYNSFTRASLGPDGEFMGGGPAGQGGALSDDYMTRMNRASIASADYINRMNRAREIFADMREMNRGGGQGSRVNVIRDEARERRNALMAIDDRGDGLRPRGAYKNLLAFRAASQLSDGQAGQAGQASAGGLRGAGGTDPMAQVKDLIGAQQAQIELEKSLRGGVDPYKAAEVQSKFLKDETDLAQAQRERMGVLGNDVLRAMGENPEDPAVSARLQAAIADITSAGQIEIGKDKDGNPVMRDFGKLSQTEQARAIQERVLDRSILDSFADELEGLGYDRNMAYNPGFLDQLTFSKENPTNYTLVPGKEGYSTLGNPRLFFGDTGSATYLGGDGKPVQVRMDNMQDRLSGPAKKRLNQLYGSAL